ncbi:MAG: hypothetical protein QRY72_05225 [Candidatus Rhabdochlamydia sp.]
MKPIERQKMCPNCDGRIPYETHQCPYCFAHLQLELNEAKSETKSPPTPLDPLSALYNPPYLSKPLPSPSQGEPQVKDTQEETLTTSLAFSSIVMLVLGSNLLTVGLLQFFFSEGGILHLEVNASYWFLMVILSIPLLYFGLKDSSKSKE